MISALNELITRMSDRKQQMVDGLPVAELWGHDAYDKHEIQIYEHVIKELKNMAEDARIETIDKDRNRFCDLYVMKRKTGEIHRIGSYHGDRLICSSNGLTYKNTTDGEQGTIFDNEENEYVIISTLNGSFMNDYGFLDTRFPEQIGAYLDREEGRR